MSPTIKQLEAFAWTARLGSFQAAANRLHTTQSAVSKRVIELEQLFDTRLFDRQYKRAKLTQQGERLLRSSEDVLSAANRLVTSMSEVTAFQGTIHIGTSELVGLTWLPSLVQLVKRQHPGLVINLDIQSGGRVMEQLRAGIIDMAIIVGPVWGQEYGSVSLAKVEFAWMASPLLKPPRTMMKPEQLASFPMLIHSPQGVATRLYDQWREQLGMPNQRTLSVNTMNVMAQLAKAGLGVSPLPVQYFAEELRTGRLLRLRVTPSLPPMEFFAVFRKDMQSPLIERIVAMAQEVCDFRRPPGDESATTRVQK